MRQLFSHRIEHISQADEAAILTLNNRHAEELSWLEVQRLSVLIEEAFYARRIGSIEAFILTFDQDANYDSPNFLWFRQRYSRFIYVDRIAVDESARGQGHARLLYEGLFAHAKHSGHALVTCEVNVEPPNPASDAFHAKLGFEEVGAAVIHDGKKNVRYYARDMNSLR